MILLVGQVAREASDREAFQEIDYRRMFGQMAKWVVQIEDARRIPEHRSARHFTPRCERPARPWSSVALPEDMLVDEVEVRRRRPLQDRARCAGGRGHGDAARAARCGRGSRW